MKTVFFTVDADRDAAWPENGAVCAGTKGCREPSFSSTGKGLLDLVSLLGEKGIPATFFFEARAAMVLSEKMDLPALMEGHEVACHGFDHEDFVGRKTGVKMGRDRKKRLLEKALHALQKVFPSHGVKGFRAPYMHCDEELLGLVKETGFAYDSSLYSGSTVTVPHGLKEIYVSKWCSGLSGYLWPLMEGKRKPEEYINAVKESRGNVVVATHSWHARHSVENGVLGAKAAEENLRRVEAVLDGLKGERFGLMSKA